MRGDTIELLATALVFGIVGVISPTRTAMAVIAAAAAGSLRWGCGQVMGRSSGPISPPWWGCGLAWSW